MANNNNGFMDMADYLGKLSEVDPKKVTLESLEKAASFYMERLIPKIPNSLLMDDRVKVTFEDTSFYWRFAENGTVNQRGQHFASGTYEQNKSTIEELMTQDIMELWKG
mgnify:CR=1 FL=1